MKKKKIYEMSKEDFDQVPVNLALGLTTEFSSLVIIPTNELHYSGFMRMEFVLVDKDFFPICRVSGSTDIIHIDGIGGGGETTGTIPKQVKIKGWQIDCLPCGYLRLFADKTKALKIYPPVSDFEVFGIT